MPVVDGERFPYTDEGRAAARRKKKRRKKRRKRRPADQMGGGSLAELVAQAQARM